ncbi:VWA domain-containing protein [Phaeacidiphilus oryzae]|uniref:VWA domain-containing protein n=1 Tax=Phaeacidiphilus oryzae TaxID=348818 RepID=UPI00126A0A87|nr:VWA domain-containing protein [Phaeacidiphilus oryzae]
MTVRTGGDRTAPSTVGPLAGVRLGLYADSSDASPVNATWAVCTSDAEGDCSFEVPAAGVGTQYWVKQLPDGAPSGWYTNPLLRTGNSSGSGSLATPYTFQTPVLAADRTYSSTGDFMHSTDYRTSPYKGSFGIWQQSRSNPPLPEKCGLDVAVLLDLSSSLGSSGLASLKAATGTFIDSLVGTPSRVALFSFDGSSPSTSVGTNYPDLMPVSTQGNADKVKSIYQNWTLGSGTNWDQALYSVARAPQTYELAVVITDGNPSYFDDPAAGSGTYTNLASTEGGVYSANAVKAKGTRVVALGVGSGVEGDSGLNLRAVSGETPFDGSNYETADYYQAADFSGAAEALHNLVVGQCANAVTVIKQIAPPETSGEDVTGAEPAGAGWTFTADSASPGVTGVPVADTTTGDGTGSVSFEPGYEGSESSIDLAVSETQHPGYELVTQGGRNAVCTDLDTDSPVAVTNGGPASGSTPGFSVEAPRGDAVTCTVYDRLRSVPRPATVELHKRWVVDGTAYANGRQPAGLSARAELTDPAGYQAAAPWDDTRTGYTVGDEVTVDERTSVTAEGCRLTGSRITDADGDSVDLPVPHRMTLAQRENDYTLTNTVECASAPGGGAGPSASAGPGASASAGSAGPLAATGLSGPGPLSLVAGAAGLLLLGGGLALAARRRGRH